MRKIGSGFLGYKVYRRKFLVTLAVIILLFAIVFTGCMMFFTTIWAGSQRQEAYDCFNAMEKKIGSIKDQLGEFIDSMYTSRKMMMDAQALFYAESMDEYLMDRKENSLSTTAQITYLPGDLKRLFLNNRTAIRGITLSSDSGIKAIWLDQLSGDMHIQFGLKSEDSAGRIAGFGDLLLYTSPVRDPDAINKKLGNISFWVDKKDVFEDILLNTGEWSVFHDARMLDKDMVSSKAHDWIEEAYHLEKPQGSFSAEGLTSVYYTRMDSTQYECTYVAAAANTELWISNQKTILVLLAALGAVVAGALIVSYAGFRADSVFLYYIVQILGGMENGDFSVAENMDIELPNRYSEYGRIALVLQDVNMKLKGYIQTEYILKLKQQEAAMKALQQQINPHFLYNTLETIRSRALVKGDKGTADAIEQLGSLFRARVRSADQITLKEEFGLLKMYLKIMQLRFADNFVYQIELEAEVEEVPTVNFWLQPLAENFFTHGFDRESEFNLLIVEGHSAPDGVYVDITDNGTGMTAERLKEVSRNMHEGSEDPEADIGIRNVYMRLSYFYGEGFNMEICNAKEGGVHISIRIRTA